MSKKGALNPNQTQYIYQCYTNGQQYSQIAAALGITVTKVEKVCDDAINIGFLQANPNVISMKKGKKVTNVISNQQQQQLFTQPQYNFTSPQPQQLFMPTTGITQNTQPIIMPVKVGKKNDSAQKKHQQLMSSLTLIYQLLLKIDAKIK